LDTFSESNTESALLRVLFDSVPAMLAYWDRNQRCKFANHAYEKWLGVRPEAVRRMSLKELLGPLYPLTLPYIEGVLRGEAQEFERELPDPSKGPARYMQAHYIPHIVAGVVQGFCVLVTDITRRKRAEHALHEMEHRMQARARLAALTTLAAGIAHEINNPLAAVLGNVELALEQLDAGRPNPASLRSLLHDARGGAARVRDIIESMRLLARGEVTQREIVNVADTLERSLALASNTLKYRALLQRDLDPSCYIEGSTAQLAQVFVNLLTNAAQALPEESAQQNQIRVSCRRDADRVVIEVADNGSGIADGLHSLIFEPFFTTKSQAGRMGLGLSVCRGIVEGFGGQISVSSEAGKGCLFRVLLPAAAAPAQVLSPPALGQQLQRPVPAYAARSRLLLVDDQPEVARTLRRVLGRDHDVTEVHSGKDAVAALCALGEPAFDLVLCDLMMPEMSGEEVYLAVSRKRPELARRFVFMTGGAFTSRGRRFLDSIGAAVLQKPFSIQAARDIIQERLGAMLREAEASG
jgi:PAS domain S-box-containing protein